VVYKYKPHKRTITDLHFNPADHSKLLSSSYDGSIRTFDMNKAEFDTWEHTNDKFALSGFDISQDGHSIWFCTSDGQVGLKDNRAKDEPIVRQACEKKVGCVHLNPVHQHLLAGASNDRHVYVWDIRMWDNKKEVEPLHSFEHGYSATSAYWSPNGDLLASTSYDDYVRLFSLDKKGEQMELKSAIPHNNHTGR
jgi:WD40 repeat protein